jgi:succinoglycan biosynthesis transport protein ExoP
VLRLARLCGAEMLNRVGWPRTVNPHIANSDEPFIDLVEAFHLLRRQLLLFASVLTFAISVAVIYLAATPSRYTASAMLLFDVRNVEPFQQQGSANAATDSAYVDSQVEVLKSDFIARSVITKLNLLSDPEFASPTSSLLAAIGGLLNAALDAFFTAENNSMTTDQLARTVPFFRSNLTIKRTGLTYIVDVAYRSLDPNKAAKISNAVTEAYIVGQLESKYDSARRASSWLQQRIDELQTQAQSAERAVAEYKTKNNIAENGTRLLSEQELAHQSSQRRAILKDLESSAQTYRTLHETFVQRATQMQTLPTTEARVISAASPPLAKSDPKTILVLGAASLLGLVGGLAAAFAREHLNTGFLSPNQLEQEAGINCLGVLPSLPDNHSNPRSRRGNASANLPDVDRRQNIPNDHDAGRRLISRDSDRYCALDRSLSACTEAIQFLAAHIASTDQRRKIIGISSALPREGKSMVAASLGELIADSGHKVLLVDCDLRNSGLTRQLAPLATQGLMDAIASRVPVKDLVWRDPITRLDFLPSSPSCVRKVHPSGTLSSPAMRKLLESLQVYYDHVILDLPSIIPVADVKAASHLIESFILVIEWGRTSQSAVMDALNTAPLVSEKLLGAVLNKANPTVLKRLSYRGRYFRA